MSDPLTNAEAQETRDEQFRMKSLIRLIALVTIINLCLMLGLVFLIDDVQNSVHDLTTFTDEVTEISPEEQREAEAVANAVALVPRIITILCEQQRVSACG